MPCGYLPFIDWSSLLSSPARGGGGARKRAGRGKCRLALSKPAPPPHFVRSPSPASRWRKGDIVLATRDAPESCAPPPRTGLPEGRRSAVKAQPSIGRATPSDVAIGIVHGRGSGSCREPLAFRRSAAALARANASAVGSAPVTALPETWRNGRYPLPPVSSLPRSAEAGRCAGRAGTRSRPGTVCETARGHRTRSAPRSHPECALQ
jgi:hypothetical protein